MRNSELDMKLNAKNTLLRTAISKPRSVIWRMNANKRKLKSKNFLSLQNNSKRCRQNEKILLVWLVSFFPPDRWKIVGRRTRKSATQKRFNAGQKRSSCKLFRQRFWLDCQVSTNRTEMATKKKVKTKFTTAAPVNQKYLNNLIDGWRLQIWIRKNRKCCGTAVKPY